MQCYFVKETIALKYNKWLCFLRVLTRHHPLMWAIFYISKWLFRVKCDATNLVFRWDCNYRNFISAKHLTWNSWTYKQSCQQHLSHQNIQNSKVSWLQSPCSQTNKSSQFFQTAWSIPWSCPLWSHPPSVRQHTKSWLWKQRRVIVEAATIIAY